MVNYMSRAGSHHGYNDERNEDSVMYKIIDDYCIMVLADGVSSCAKAGNGAKIACEALMDYILAEKEILFDLDKIEISGYFISCILDRLKKKAQSELHNIEDYSSTAACVLADLKNSRMLYFSIGDSLIIGTQNNRCKVISMPSDSTKGCYVTTTGDAFITANAGIIDLKDFNSVMICSDGAWHLMYEKNRLNAEVKKMLIEQDSQKLKDVFESQERFDDCSFIVVDLNLNP